MRTNIELRQYEDSDLLVLHRALAGMAAQYGLWKSGERATRKLLSSAVQQLRAESARRSTRPHEAPPTLALPDEVLAGPHTGYILGVLLSFEYFIERRKDSPAPWWTPRTAGAVGNFLGAIAEAVGQAVGADMVALREAVRTQHARA